VTLDALNTAHDDVARRELERCCGSPRWVSAMSARRPFADKDQVLRAAEECWWSLEGGDWLEAFSKHPRIGERAVGWAADEQSGVTGASDVTVKQLAALNHAYERKFGHVFLIFATGKSADLMLAELQRRMVNDPATELRNAATEQAKITGLRLRKLLSNTLESQRHP
jgi:2-oxo-4-hydroxy-4-carboxy-5-ureidoimidazoline decarboxylase